MSPPGKSAIRVDEVRQNVELEAQIVEVVNCADNLVKGLLHQIRSQAPLHGQLALALKGEFSELDSFPLSSGLPLHVCEALIFTELLCMRRFVDQVPGHFLKLILEILLILVVVFVTLVGIVWSCLGLL